MIRACSLLRAGPFMSANQGIWRRVRDSNPRCKILTQRFSRPPRSTTPATLRALGYLFCAVGANAQEIECSEKPTRIAVERLDGWGRGIRTPAGGVRVRSPTTRRSPNRNAAPDSGVECHFNPSRIVLLATHPPRCAQACGRSPPIMALMGFLYSFGIYA